MTTQFKTFRFSEMEVKTDGDAGTIQGYGSTFGGDPDSYGDIIAPGAFKASLKQRMPKMLYQHDSGLIAGVWDSAEEDNHGLFLKGHFIPTTVSQNAYQECLAGALDSMSIGYRTNDQQYDPKTGTSTLTDITLYEVSLVTFPANENATISAVKSMPTTIRELEKCLRDAGYSRTDAKAIVQHFMAKEEDQRDAEPDLTPLFSDFFKAFN